MSYFYFEAIWNAKNQPEGFAFVNSDRKEKENESLER